MSASRWIRQLEDHVRRPGRKLDVVLVVDVEATTDVDRGRGALRDIIEVGACKLQLRDGAIEDPDSVLVRPNSSEVSAYCTRLTGITVERAAAGIAFVDACGWLRQRYDSEALVWASYGQFDRNQFLAQCAREGVTYPFGRPHLDIKLLTALRQAWARERGLSRALASLDIEMSGRHHSGRDDAVNGAKLLFKVLRG